MVPMGSTSLECPPPQVFVVPAEPYGYMALSGLLLILWVRALWVRRRAGPVELPGAGPEPGGFKEFSSALKGLGFKGAEIKDRWAQVDPGASLEVQITQAVRAGQPG
jgi:hypothetical protein